MLTPTVVRTWAPRGQTPIFRHSQRHDRISVISGISVSPTRRPVGLYYQWHHHNIREVEAVAFLRHLLRHLRGHVVLIWDNLGVHKAKLVKKLCRRAGRMRKETERDHFEREQRLSPRERPAGGSERRPDAAGTLPDFADAAPPGAEAEARRRERARTSADAVDSDGDEQESCAHPRITRCRRRLG
jgi:hypothetical protein